MKITRKDRNFIIFWVLAILFLAGWYLFWQIRDNRNFGPLQTALDMLPMDASKKEEYRTVMDFAQYLLKKDGQEKTFLILFQNNMELRPGGGYIGSFGILKMKDGKVLEMQTHDLSNFDGRVPDGIEPPYPMKETLHINSWKMRDSNFSPDFSVNARKAEEFYHLGQGGETFDGIVAVNTNVLTSFLKVTGPIELEGYSGTYDSESAILALEYQVEKGYMDQNIAKGDRKNVLNILAQEIIKRIFMLNVSDRIKLAEIILEDLNHKDIQLYFKDDSLQAQVEKAGWDGKLKIAWPNDYLMMVDANLGAYKSDYYIRRNFDYTIDLSGNTPKADLKITYQHTAKQKDWMTRDYLSYLRVYVPKNSWLESSVNIGEKRFGDESGKKYFGSIVTVPLGTTKTVEYIYTLDKNVLSKNYDLLIQKQSGSGAVTGKVTVIQSDGTVKTYAVNLDRDWKLSEN